MDPKIRKVLEDLKHTVRTLDRELISHMSHLGKDTLSIYLKDGKGVLNLQFESIRERTDFESELLLLWEMNMLSEQLKSLVASLSPIEISSYTTKDSKITVNLKNRSSIHLSFDSIIERNSFMLKHPEIFSEDKKEL